MIRLATGVTPNYLPRARAFITSLNQHCNVEPNVFAVNFYPEHPNFGAIPAIPVDYNQAWIRLPKFMLQHGGFCQFAPRSWDDNDIVIFTDADAILQRPFTKTELAEFEELPPRFILAGYNMPNEKQTLMDEATRISPTTGLDAILAAFPAANRMACRNWGFVVASMWTWRELCADVLKLDTICANHFMNPARVQWMCCYAAQRGHLELRDLSPVIHAHGHCGLKDGLTKGEDGLWRQDGKVVAFAHAL